MRQPCGAGHTCDEPSASGGRLRELPRSRHLARCQRYSSVKPSAQLTLVRSQHLPPSKTPGQRCSGLALAAQRGSGTPNHLPMVGSRVLAGQRRALIGLDSRRCGLSGEYAEKFPGDYCAAPGCGARVVPIASHRETNGRAPTLIKLVRSISARVRCPGGRGVKAGHLSRMATTYHG